MMVIRPRATAGRDLRVSAHKMDEDPNDGSQSNENPARENPDPDIDMPTSGPSQQNQARNSAQASLQTLHELLGKDSFCQWLHKEVVETTAVQIKHIKLLAARHFLVVLHNVKDRDEVLAGGPYYLRKRMVYTTPWEPGFNTKKVLAKKMACLEEEGWHLLSTLGQVARMTELNEAEFPNLRACVLMDMTLPLPTVLKTNLDGEIKRFEIQYDVLPDACFTCHERGHIARGEPPDAGLDPAPLLDLNKTPRNKEEIIAQNKLEKQQKKERKKEKKRETRRKKAELLIAASLNVKQVAEQTGDDLSSSDESTPGKARFWQGQGEETHREEEDTMDMTSGWDVLAQGSEGEKAISHRV
ncbi:hypothetical protein R1sor_007829 [Riccia sorocarpa]|uniref:DUF4283 domain-containing protein n=1 Tax=Riccia sorocarpa TaxID=122646 RepID=A0ABD3HRY5_9MARC